MRSILLIGLSFSGLIWSQDGVATPLKKARPSPFAPRTGENSKTAQLPPIAVPGFESMNTHNSSQGMIASPRVTMVPKHPPSQAAVPSIETVKQVASKIEMPRLAAISTPQPPPQIKMPALFAIATPVIAQVPVRIASATPENLASIAMGMPYDAVVGKLGVPAMRMSSDEDGHMMESLRFESKGSRVATIKMVDGQVATVDLAK